MSASARSFRGGDLAYVAVFAALIAALAIVPGFNIGPVPFTLQTIGVGVWAPGADSPRSFCTSWSGQPVFPSSPREGPGSLPSPARRVAT